MRMKSIEELEDFFNTELMPKLQELDEVRKQKVNQILMWSAPVVIVAMILTGMLLGHGDAAFAPLIGALVIVFFIFRYVISSYVGDFKDEIITKIIHFADPGLKYHKNSYLPQFDFVACKIYQRKPDKYQGDDRVQGVIGATSIDFSEINAQYETRDKNGNRSYVTYFKGLFFKADFNKHFKGETFVLPDKSEKYFGNFFQKMNVGRPPLVKLEDPEFEQLFVVYGSDPIEARYILSPSLMRRLTDFCNKTKSRIGVSFVRSCVYITIPFNRNLFEPRVFQTLIDFEPIKQYYRDVSLAIGIVEDLNLNTRIWTKE
jgi:flagellar biosynthesis protein FliQ